MDDVKVYNPVTAEWETATDEHREAVRAHNAFLADEPPAAIDAPVERIDDDSDDEPEE